MMKRSIFVFLNLFLVVSIGKVTWDYFFNSLDFSHTFLGGILVYAFIMSVFQCLAVVKRFKQYPSPTQKKKSEDKRNKKEFFKKGMKK